MLKKLLIAGAIAATASTAALAQGQFPSGYVQGNAGASAGQGSPQPPTAIFDRAFGSTRGAIFERAATAWGIIAPSATVGLPLVSNGVGADPGYGAVSPSALPFPTATTLGGIESIAQATHEVVQYIDANGQPHLVQLGWGDLAGTILPTGLTIGVAGSTLGTIAFANTTSGTETIEAASGALGAGVATLPAGIYNFVGDSLSQTLTNKTLNCANNTCTIRLGSDVTGQLPVANGGTGLSSLTLNAIYRGQGSSALVASALTDDGTKIATSEALDLTSQPLVTEIANAGTTGTTLDKLAKLTGAPATAVITAATDTSGAIGIVVGGAGTTGNALIVTQGQASCIFDGPTTAGDYVQISSTIGGDCHDIGTSYPSSGQAIGRVLSTNGGAG
ncbi:MAG: hypothetical protein KGL35_23640, partial [Bradyrhizobium sp.]|nr:hypothetical protein [Bradyrhizobium sp.]